MSVPDSPPVLSLPGALAFTTRQGGRRNCRQPAPSSPAFPGSTTAGMPLGTAYPHGPAFVPGPSRFSHSRDTATYLWFARYPCQVTVSDSPPGLTRSRSAGSFASRCGWYAWSIPTSPGSVLTGHSWFNYDGGCSRNPLHLTVPLWSQALLGFLAAEALRRNCGLHATPARLRSLTARRV